MVRFNRFTPSGLSHPEGNEWGEEHQQKLYLHPQDSMHYKGKGSLSEHNSIDVFRRYYHVTNIKTLNSSFLSSTAF